MSTDTDLAPQGRPDKVPVAFGAAPTDLDQAWRIATALAGSEIIPKPYWKKPADVLAAILLGKEVGLAPMTALQSIAVINGRPGIFGDGLLALIVACLVYLSHAEYYEVLIAGEYQKRDSLTADDLKADSTRAVCTFVRKDTKQRTTATFSVAQAKKAGLWTKAGPWIEYPDRMLKMRARSWAARDAFPDVLKGLHAAEELIDTPIIEVPSAPVVQRRSEQPQPPSAAAAAPPEPVLVLEQNATVKGITEKADCCLVRLSTGEILATTSDDAITELKKFVGKPDRLLVQYRLDADDAGADRKVLVDFRQAD